MSIMANIFNEGHISFTYKLLYLIFIYAWIVTLTSDPILEAFSHYRNQTIIMCHYPISNGTEVNKWKHFLKDM